MSRKPILERAFEIANAGAATTLDELRATLKSEGYADAATHTSFPVIRKQLRDAMQKRIAAGTNDEANGPAGAHA